MRVSGGKKKRISRIYTSKQIFQLLVLPVLLHPFCYFTFLTKSPNFLPWVTLSLCLAVSLFPFKAVLRSSLELAHQKNSLVPLSINQRETS